MYGSYTDGVAGVVSLARRHQGIWNLNNLYQAGGTEWIKY
jgi:hypothetical protein